MFYGIVILILTGAISFGIIASFKRKYPSINANFLTGLFFFHTAIALVYYLYAIFNPSDSRYYYLKLINFVHGDSWFGYYGTSTSFIEFLGFPFVNYFNFSYEAVMALFSFFGFIGFIYFYIFLRQNLRFKHTFFGFDLMTIVLCLPNLHFWSSSFGKGSVIYMAIGMLFYGLSSISKRWITLGVAAVIIYHVRPHILLMIIVSSIIGFAFTTKGLSMAIRLTFLIVSVASFYFIYGDVLNLVGVDENEFLSQGLNLSGRARELTKATSGIDINTYSLPMQLFTFIYRPLFIDATGILGLIVSVENVFYILFTIRLFTWSGLKYLIFSDFLVKTAFFSFLTASVALAQVSGNLGLAIRQKSQVMILFLFVVLSFMDNVKWQAYQKNILARRRALVKKQVPGTNQVSQ